jgi:F-type H+-transporting ATPase subunit b
MNSASIAVAADAWAQEGDPGGEGALRSETGIAIEEGEHGAFPPFDPSTFASQLVWLAITFAVFYMLIGRIIIPRIGGILETRRDRISQDLDEAQRLKEETDAAIAAYEHELAEARNRAHAIGQQARDEAKARADADRARVEAELAEQLTAAETQISGIKQKAMAEVDAVAAAAAEAIIRQLVGGSVTKAELSSAIGDAAKDGGNGV